MRPVLLSGLARYQKYAQRVTKIHCPFVLLLPSNNFHRIVSETTQIWGKEFPVGMLRMVPGNSSFFVFLRNHPVFVSRQPCFRRLFAPLSIRSPGTAKLESTAVQGVRQWLKPYLFATSMKRLKVVSCYKTCLREFRGPLKTYLGDGF